MTDTSASDAPATFAATWRRAVDVHADRTFLVFENPDGALGSWTYVGFDELVGSVAAELVRRGVGAGACVHLALTNSVAFVAVWLATARVGAWIVPVDPASAERELAEQIERTRPVVGFCGSTRAAPYRAAAAAAGLAQVIDVDEADVGAGWAVPDVAAPPPSAEPAPTDRAAVMFTSGTTGRPKGVEITQANYAFTGTVMAAACDLSPDDRYLVVLPMFHANAQYYSFAPAISVGASVALMPAFSASGFLDQAARHGATCASLFAGPMRMILARGAAPAPGRGPRLRHCWFAQNVAADQYEQLADWFGCRPRQLYGMTETIPAVLTDSADDPRPDTMGYVTPGCDVDVQDASGRSCAPDEIGEVVVRGVPGLTLFAGYLDDPATTASSYRDGWFLTGDRARRDAHGRFRFDGRRSDVLKVAGENVSVVEVESVLSAHPGVLEAAVVGAPDDVRDEVPVAFVVVAPGTPPDGIVDELRAWCDERLAKAKRPRAYTLVDELPRTSVGKIRKFVLKEEASA
jgi:carnitine-CoA ligase